MTPRRFTLDELNAMPPDEAAAALDGLYEHSPRFARAALAARPFADLDQLLVALEAAVEAAGRDAQLALLRAHPQLAGKAMVAGTLTDESAGEQARSGLTHCTPEEFRRLHELNDRYERRFGWPFILAVRGADGQGLTRAQVLHAFEQRVHADPADEFAECLRQVQRIAGWRLRDRIDPAGPPRAGA